MKELQIIEQMRSDWFNPSMDAVARRLALWRSYDEKHQARVLIALDLVRRSREWLIDAYLYPLRDELSPVSRIALAPDPLRLLRHAERNGSEPADVRRRFEALHYFDLACGYANIEREEPTRFAREDLDDLIEMFDARVFAGSENVTVWTRHDERQYTVSSVHVRDERESDDERENPFPCRMIRGVGSVFFDHRVKELDRTWLKIQKQIADESIVEKYVVWDRCGIVFVVDGDASMGRLVHALREAVGQDGELFEDLHAIRGRPINVHSAPNFHGKQMGIRWRGRLVEVQLYTFGQYLDNTMSLGLANHEMYRLRQLIRFYCPEILFPSSVYRTVDWGSNDLRELLFERQAARVGWRVDPARFRSLMRTVLGTG